MEFTKVKLVAVWLDNKLSYVDNNNLKKHFNVQLIQK